MNSEKSLLPGIFFENGLFKGRSKIIEAVSNSSIAISQVYPNNLTNDDYIHIFRDCPSSMKEAAEIGILDTLRMNTLIHLVRFAEDEVSIAKLSELINLNTLTPQISRSLIYVYSDLKKIGLNSEQKNALINNALNVIIQSGQSFEYEIKSLIELDCELVLRANYARSNLREIKSTLDILSQLSYNDSVLKDKLFKMLNDVLYKKTEQEAKKKRDNDLALKKALSLSKVKVCFQNTYISELKNHEVKNQPEFMRFFSDHPDAFKPKPNFFLLNIAFDKGDHLTCEEVFITNFNLANKNGYSKSIMAILEDNSYLIYKALKRNLCNINPDVFIEKFLNREMHVEETLTSTYLHELVNSFTSLKSKETINAAIEYIVGNCTQEEVSNKYKIEQSNLSRCVKKIMLTQRKIEKLKNTL